MTSLRSAFISAKYLPEGFEIELIGADVINPVIPPEIYQDRDKNFNPKALAGYFKDFAAV